MSQSFLRRNQKLDPSTRPTVCEVCGIIKPLREMKSMAAVYRMPGYDHNTQVGLLPYQCDDKQHFGCTHEHALLAMMYCLFEHIHEGPHEEQGVELQHEVLVDIKNILDAYLQKIQNEHSKESEHES